MQSAVLVTVMVGDSGNRRWLAAEGTRYALVVAVSAVNHDPFVRTSRGRHIPAGIVPLGAGCVVPIATDVHDVGVNGRGQGRARCSGRPHQVEGERAARAITARQRGGVVQGSRRAGSRREHGDRRRHAVRLRTGRRAAVVRGEVPLLGVIGDFGGVWAVSVAILVRFQLADGLTANEVDLVVRAGNLDGQTVRPRTKCVARLLIDLLLVGRRVAP